MDLFDTYCIICGNPHNDANELEDYIDILNKKQSTFNKNPINYKVEQFIKKTKWLNKCIFLTEDDEIIHKCSNKNNINNGCFVSENNNIEYKIISYKQNDSENIKYGIPVHKDCWKFIKYKYLLELKYSDIHTNTKITFNCDNDPINKYCNQFMKFINIFIEKKLYLCYSPLKDDTNSKNISRIMNRIKISSNTEIE
jgi:hypothetical protein